MSADIDMRAYAGENTEAAAVPQAIEDTNSYQNSRVTFLSDGVVGSAPRSGSSTAVSPGIEFQGAAG